MEYILGMYCHLIYIGNKYVILPVISFMCSVHHWFHEIVANISCLNLMHPLKHWRCIAVIVCTFNSILVFEAHFLALICFDDDSLETSVINFRTW